MMTETIMTIEGGQKDVLLRRANIKKCELLQVALLIAKMRLTIILQL